MGIVRFAAVIILLSLSVLLYAADVNLCEDHTWFAPPQISPSLLCQGVLDASFDRRESALKRLQRVIKSAPQGVEAYRAHEALLQLYFRAGQYRKSLAEADAMLTAKPTAKDILDLRPLLSAFSQHPDLSIARKRSMLPYVRLNDNNPHLPVLVNGKQATYYMDTGANVSVMSDAAARSFGLEIRSVASTMNDISGSIISLRVTEVDDLMIGKNRLKHVSFVVLPSGQPPFNDIPIDQQALLGIQVLHALQIISVRKDGQVEVGGARIVGGTGTPMTFYQAQPLVQMSFQNMMLAYTLDTGAVHTTLNPSFAAAFTKTIANGEKKKHTLTGMGGSTVQSSIELRQVSFLLDGTAVTLSPATVLLKSTTGISEWAAGNLGYDLLQQAAPFTLDFGRMRMFAGR